MSGPPLNLDALRNELADLVDLYPPSEWSPELLRAINGVLSMYIAELGLRNPSAPVIELVPR